MHIHIFALFNIRVYFRAGLSWASWCFSSRSFETALSLWRFRMKSALFFLCSCVELLLERKCDSLRRSHLVVTFCSNEEIVCFDMKLLPLLLLLNLSWNLDAAPSRLAQKFTFSLGILDEGLRGNAANIETPLPYHHVNNEEMCLHLLCFRFTQLKTSMICPPAPSAWLWFVIEAENLTSVSVWWKRKLWFC